MISSALQSLNIQKNHFIKINKYIMKIDDNTSDGLIIKTNKICENKNNKYSKLSTSGVNMCKGIILYLKVALTNSIYFNSSSFFDIYVDTPQEIYDSQFKLNGYSFTKINNGKKIRIFRLDSNRCKLGLMISNSDFRNKLQKLKINDFVIINDGDVSIRFKISNMDATIKHILISDVYIKSSVPNLDFRMPLISNIDCE